MFIVIENVFCVVFVLTIYPSKSSLLSTGFVLQLSVALTVNEYVPPVVGRPEMPPDELTLSPGGNDDPEAMLYAIGTWLPVV